MRAAWIAFWAVVAGLAGLACSGPRVSLDDPPDAGGLSEDFGVDAGGRDTGGRDTGGTDAGPDSGPGAILIGSQPAEGTQDVAVTEWLRLDFDGDPPEELSLVCDERALDLSKTKRRSTVFINPDVDLPQSARCVVRLSGEDILSFSTAALGVQARVIHDRRGEDNIDRLVTFPDDFFFDETSGTVQLPTDYDFPFDLNLLITSYVFAVNARGAPDGFSPLGPFLVELDAPPLPESLPRSATESIDPMSTLQLIDLSSDKLELQRRVPFEVSVRTDGPERARSHVLIIFPARPLEPQHRYALILTKRARVSNERPVGPSEFLSLALGPASPGEDGTITRARARLEEPLRVASTLSPPIFAQDIAVAVRFTVRSVDHFPDDVLKMRAQGRSAPAAYRVDRVEPDEDPNIAAVVYGTWFAPSWGNGVQVVRSNNVPVLTGSTEVPFVVALPNKSLQRPSPIIMYQHGQPGRAERSVPFAARDLAEDGFAVAGFTDIINRRFPIDPGSGEEERLQWATDLAAANIEVLVNTARHPDYPLITIAEQLAFIDLIASLGKLDVLPIGRPDGVPELDPALPLGYQGQSKGSINGTALVAYAPEIKAAVLQVGGGNNVAINIHQAANDLVEGVQGAIPSARPVDIWTALALEQWALDSQEPQNHARFLYRAPVPVGGSLVKPSVLLMEGLNDSLVPPVSTRGAAHAFGPLPHLSPSTEVPFLSPVEGPLVGNIDPKTTAAFFQFVPVGVAGVVPTPGCETINEGEGHFCPARSVEGRRQRSVFFRSAQSGVPRIIDPLE